MIEGKKRLVEALFDGNHIEESEIKELRQILHTLNVNLESLTKKENENGKQRMEI